MHFTILRPQRRILNLEEIYDSFGKNIISSVEKDRSCDKNLIFLIQILFLG